MKKILIVSHALEIGGAEKSLIGLLDSIDLSENAVDLFLLRHQGELMKYIPEGINLLPEIPQYTVLARPMKDVLLEGKIRLVLARLKGKYKAGKYARDHHYTHSAVDLEYSHKYTKHLMPEINPDTEYDLAVSYLTPHYFVAEKVRAKKKAAWIHTDYRGIEIDRESELAMWSKYDRIISISDEVSGSFAGVFPELKERMVRIDNILPGNLIRMQAEEMPEFRFPEDRIDLLSVGRYSHAKNFDNIPEICSMIRKEIPQVRWNIIGYGGDEELIRSRIREYGMEDSVILLGKKENPYPYIRECDLYVQPSRYEGKCVAVREAQMLGRPVVITEYATSHSQLNSGTDGQIVPMDNRGCADGIIRVLKDPEYMRHLADTCRQNDYSGKEEIRKFYGLL